MYKKIAISAAILALCSTSAALGYVYGGSNLGYSGYPAFDEYLSYNPSKYEVEQYVDEAREYVENCDYDIQRILEAKADAINQANEAVANYNRNHSYY